MVTQLCNERLGCLCNILFGNQGFVNLYPRRMRDPLGRETLDVFDRIQRRIVQELSDKEEALMVGYMCGGLLVKGFTVEVLVDWSVK